MVPVSHSVARFMHHKLACFQTPRERRVRQPHPNKGPSYKYAHSGATPRVLPALGRYGQIARSQHKTRIKKHRKIVYPVPFVALCLELDDGAN